MFITYVSCVILQPWGAPLSIAGHVLFYSPDCILCDENQTCVKPLASTNHQGQPRHAPGPLPFFIACCVCFIPCIGLFYVFYQNLP